MVRPQETTDQVIQLLRDHGEGDYIGERISQLEHCLQCAHLASSAGADSETIIAALLHDVGQFLPMKQANSIAGQAFENMRVGGQEEPKPKSSNSVGRVGHDTIGATYLAQRNFSSKVCSLVGAHVAAKRFLCAVEPPYHDTLSDASKQSLIMQGGPMNEEEIASWRKSGLADDMCNLRRWDDAAKVVGLDVPALETYRSLIQSHLESRV